MPDYEWTRDDRGVDTYGKDYPFDAGDKHTFEWVLKNFKKLCDTFPEVGIPKSVRHCCYCQLAEWACPKHSDYKE